MQRLFTILLILAFASVSSACIASKKFVRNEVKTSSDALNARVDTTDSNVKEVRDSVDRVNERVTGVDGRVTQLDAKTTQGMTALKTELKSDVQTVDQKAGQAQTKADRAAGEIVLLDQKFQGRNLFTISSEKAVYFRFDSARLDNQYQTALDEIAASLKQNPDALLVLEGRTDSSGDSDYNVRLGERRVEAVKRYLAVDKEVPIYRIHEISLGAARPVADNKSREGREKNRAVTLMLLTPGSSSSTATRQQQQ